MTVTREVVDYLKYLKLPVVVTPTRVELGARCGRRHILSDRLFRGDDSSPAAMFGTRAHLAAHVWWKAEDRGAKAYTEALDAGLSDWDIPEGSYHTQDLFKTLWEGYTQNARLAGDLPGEWRLVEGEVRHAGKVGEGFVIDFQCDRLVENAEGQLAIVDLKTARLLDTRWETGMLASVQQRLYKHMNEKRLDRKVDFCLVEGCQKQGTAGLVEYVVPSFEWTEAFVGEALSLAWHVGAMDRLFMETLISMVPVDKQNDFQAVYLVAAEIALTQAHIVPFNLMDCKSYGAKCPYTDLCRMDPGERVEEFLMLPLNEPKY